MDSQASLAQPARFSGIPRLSKLPLPSSFSTQPNRPPSPQRRQSLRAPLPASQLYGITQEPLSNTGSKVRPPNGVAQAPSIRKGAVRPQTPSRQPLGPADSARSQQEPCTPSRSSSSNGSYNQTNKYRRHPSQQENAYELTLVEETDGSPTLSQDSATSQEIMPRKARASLSDRTIESLSQIPPSPASVRRQSGFFPASSTSTTTTPRPTSSMGLAGRSNYGLPRAQTFGRPASPTKRPASSHLSSAPRRTASSSIPKTSIPGSATFTAPVSPVKPAGIPTPVSKLPGQSLHTRSRTMSVRSFKLTSTSGEPVGLKEPDVKPNISVKQTSKLQLPKTRPKSTFGFGSVCDEKAPSSSEALREQIAKAKAARRLAVARAQLSESEHSVSDDNFEECEDPFNQHHVGGEQTLLKRIDDARKDGRLNIASMGLKSIPDEVLQMYDSEAMKTSNVMWCETIDLVRFVASDNELETIAETVFPDVDKNALGTTAEGKGNQFGGLETLDIHGNFLTQLPLGLRRLERLSILNISRNKLDNNAFEVISQIQSLRELRLSNNEMVRELPDSIGQLQALEILDLQSNKLLALPASIGQLRNLHVLNLSQNRFSSLDMDVLTALPLTHFNIASNALTGALFPMSLSSLPKLLELDIANNAIAALSFSPTLNLPALQSLDVSNNRLGILPSIESWKSLHTLLVQDNCLSEIPEGFTKLSQLGTANFMGNSIRYLDEHIAFMASLTSLHIGGNPLISKKLLSLDTEGIKRELARRLE